MINTCSLTQSSHNPSLIPASTLPTSNPVPPDLLAFTRPPSLSFHSPVAGRSLYHSRAPTNTCWILSPVDPAVVVVLYYGFAQSASLTLFSRAAAVCLFFIVNAFQSFSHGEVHIYSRVTPHELGSLAC